MQMETGHPIQEYMETEAGPSENGDAQMGTELRYCVICSKKLYYNHATKSPI